MSFDSKINEMLTRKYKKEENWNEEGRANTIYLESLLNTSSLSKTAGKTVRLKKLKNNRTCGKPKKLASSNYTKEKKLKKWVILLKII